MDIAALNNTALSALSSASTPTSEAIGVAMLSNQLDVSQSMSDSLIRAMELSVNPAVGGNFDVSVQLGQHAKITGAITEKEIGNCSLDSS